ncbi:MAG: hypothetical protein H0S79_11590 [Anaerolineaceae bacterium]|nr:hypothetical protein [Anaerolineaceae bacterium]
MPPTSNRLPTRRTLLVISLGWLVAIIGWVAAGQWETFTLQNAVVSLGGFPLALFAVALFPKNGPASNPKSLLTWLFLAFLYPLVTLLWLCFEVFNVAPMEDFSWLTHPALLVFNLFAVLFSGPLFKRLSETLSLSKQLRKAFTCGNGSVIPALLWWLWHLPFIFVNGAALTHMNYPPLWQTLYLLTVLAVSFFLTWGKNKERREVTSTAS